MIGQLRRTLCAVYDSWAPEKKQKAGAPEATVTKISNALDEQKSSARQKIDHLQCMTKMFREHRRFAEAVLAGHSGFGDLVDMSLQSLRSKASELDGMSQEAFEQLVWATGANKQDHNVGETFLDDPNLSAPTAAAATDVPQQTGAEPTKTELEPADAAGAPAGIHADAHAGARTHADIHPHAHARANSNSNSNKNTNTNIGAAGFFPNK
jgi:hypothetical protein